MLGGETVIARTLGCFIDHLSLAAIVIATSQPEAIQQACAASLAHAKRRGLPVIFAAGGATRADSVRNAVEAAPADVEWIAVHDAARPLVSRELIDATLAAAVEHGAATPALPVTLTIKEAESATLPAPVKRTIPRSTLFAVQTPQIALRGALLEAIKRCPVPLAQVTDDLQLLELAGMPTWLILGQERNLKLTTPADLALAANSLG
jgi:2-C-methyl-D-erythritol 4-phosphate cytidylyltransferase